MGKIVPEKKVIVFVNDSGCKFICFLGKYKNRTTKMKITCLCGHERIISVYQFKNHFSLKLCKNCCKEIQKRAIRRPVSDVISRIKNLGFLFIDFPDGYKNGLSKISYSCKVGHITIRGLNKFFQNPTCGECKRIKMREFQKGSLSLRWKGGISNLKKQLSKYIKKWKQESMIASNYTCVVTGKNFEEIHHLYSFTAIIHEALFELGLSLYETVENYSQFEMDSLINKLEEIHSRYPLGVCLTRNIHILFHKLYGADGSTTPEQFYDFVSRIKSGEIQIPY